MQLNWALVSGKQMEDDGTMETNIPHINPMSQGTPHWRTYLLVHGYIKERWKLLEMDGRTFAVFFCSLIFFRWIGGMPQMPGYIPLVLSFFFREQVTLCKRKNRGKSNRWCLKFPCMST